MKVYKGDGDVVKMVNMKDGTRLNPNQHEWVLKNDALRDINKFELLAEDLESYHLAMDDLGVPRVDDRGVEYSAYGRALVLALVLAQNKKQE